MRLHARCPPVPHGWSACGALPLLKRAPSAAVLGVGLVQPFWAPLHLLTFFVAALFCHGELARRRPPARDLTAFYLALAVGGVLGGAFNALVAPAVSRPARGVPAGGSSSAAWLYQPSAPGWHWWLAHQCFPGRGC